MNPKPSTLWGPLFNKKKKKGDSFLTAYAIFLVICITAYMAARAATNEAAIAT
jgi:hypothetical protein